MLRELTQQRCAGYRLISCPNRVIVRGVSPLFCRGYASIHSQDPSWRRIPQWENVSDTEYLDYKWQMNNSIYNARQLYTFLEGVLPRNIPSRTGQTHAPHSYYRMITASNFLDDIKDGAERSPMSIRLTPHILSLIDWTNPLNDPLLRQFVPLGSQIAPDHPRLRLDSLDETADSPVKGLVHRYTNKALFLGRLNGWANWRPASSVCPVYCRFCTRSYSVGVNTEIVAKSRFLPIYKKWDAMFDYIEQTPHLYDIVVSGGDSYNLTPEQLRYIGERLLKIPHVRRFRFASKGLAICPSRILDRSDQWADVLIDISNQGRKLGKQVALHTHVNHPNEITWVTAAAAQRLFEEGVTVRNQTVLLNGVNNDLQVMQQLIQSLADINIQPKAYITAKSMYSSQPLPTLRDQLRAHGLYIGDAGQVKWKNGNRHHPRNWPVAVKTYGMSLIIFLDFFT
ncbi:MAG: hypothetical protein Q9160_005952 [Pyrenula sp. 1 TL-2023]